MERLRRLSDFWAWLPAFRVAAETAHLPTASKLLQVSPSALSRSVRLLERSVGVKLFDREGRTLRINAAGERFLASVRDAMRMVDEGLAAATNRQVEGPLRISAPAVLSQVILPAVRSVREAYPGIVPCLGNHMERELSGLLLRGQLDLALVVQPLDHPRLKVSELGEELLGVYCGKDHPLHGAKNAKAADVVRHAFVAIETCTADGASDGWPAAQARRVALRVTQLESALDACAGGGYLAVLPCRVVEPRRSLNLWQVPFAGLPSLKVYAASRQSLVSGGIVELFAAHVALGLEKGAKT